MKFLFSVAVISCLFMYTNQESIETLDDVLAYPTAPAMVSNKYLFSQNNMLNRRRKREVEETKSNQAKFLQFVENKLIEHTQALESILSKTANNEELLKQLIGRFIKNMEEPKMPERIDIHHQARRSSSVVDSETPFNKFGQLFPTYGVLFKHIVMRSFENDEEPKTLVEDNQPQESRRAYGGKPLIGPSTDDHSPSPWCSIAVLCHRKYNPVCGYDDNFGYGKFDDLCHMLQVNCYWKYNFALVPFCRPILKK